MPPEIVGRIAKNIGLPALQMVWAQYRALPGKGELGLTHIATNGFRDRAPDPSQLLEGVDYPRLRLTTLQNRGKTLIGIPPEPGT